MPPEVRPALTIQKSTWVHEISVVWFYLTVRGQAPLPAQADGTAASFKQTILSGFKLL